MSNDIYNRGMKVRREVLGNTYVDRAEAAKTGFDADFQEFITTTAWGSVWSRAGLTRRERSLIVIAMMVAMGRDEELALHIRATKNTGASKDDVKEVLIQSAVYAGVPAANNAFRIAKQVYDGLESK